MSGLLCLGGEVGNGVDKAMWELKRFMVMVNGFKVGVVIEKEFQFVFQVFDEQFQFMDVV